MKNLAEMRCLAPMIKATVSIVFMLAVVGLSMASGAAPGLWSPAVKDQRPIAAFTQIELSGAGTLLITQGQTPTLAVEAAEEVLNSAATKVEREILKIGPRDELGLLGPSAGRTDITYHLCVTDLTKLDLRGSASVRSEGTLTLSSLEVAGAGSNEVNLLVDAGSIELNMQGAGEVTISGVSDTLRFASKDSTGLRASKLCCQTVTVDCGGSSRVEVNAVDELAVRIAGSASVSYLGDPALTTAVFGSGAISKETP
ncbi:MAG: DUF2807 domain-containing protein [Armatimonadetes bacterium]|nr:DUF2807 domain-containing protein [Armatimonadota bacterium]